MSRELPEPKNPKRRISPAVRKAIELMATGKVSMQIDAAARAGLSPEHLSRMLGRPEVREILEQRTRAVLSAGKLRAAHRLVDLLEASSEHVALDASKHTLAIGGIKPAESGANVNIINNVQPGYIVDLRMRDAPTNSSVVDDTIETVE